MCHSLAYRSMLEDFGEKFSFLVSIEVDTVLLHMGQVVKIESKVHGVIELLVIAVDLERIFAYLEGRVGYRVDILELLHID